MKKNRAFTLAEVLITLGIIGVVAAMTIPNLIQKNQEKQTVVKLRATQSVLSQALRMSEQENGDASGWVSEYWTSSDAINIANNLKPYLKIAIDCGVSDTKHNCIKKSYKRKNGSAHEVNYATDSRYYKIVLMNGTAIWWKSTDNVERTSNAYIHFFIDTNGDKLPNTWGHDLFAFAYINNGLKPYGTPDSYYPYTNSCIPKNSTGYGCAYYVLQTGKMDYLHK